MKVERIQAHQVEYNRMATAKKITRDSPGLFIEETLFTCLARFCRVFNGGFERHEELFKPVVSHLDNDDLARLVEQCADETTRVDLKQPHSIARPEAVIVALWAQPVSNELFKEWFAVWLSEKAKEVREWQAESPDPMAARFKELCGLYKLAQGESDALALAVMARQKYGGMEQISGRLGPCGTAMRAAFLGISPEEYVRLLAPKGRLRRFGCLNKEGGLDGEVWTYLIGIADTPLPRRFFRKCEGPVLP